MRFHNLLQTLISHLERHDICGAVDTTLYGEIGQTLIQGLGPRDYSHVYRRAFVNLIKKHGFSPAGDLFWCCRQFFNIVYRTIEPLNDAADTLSALSAKNGALRDYFHRKVKFVYECSTHSDMYSI